MLHETNLSAKLSEAYQRPSGGLCAILRDRLKTYKAKHPRLSSQQIAKRFNMTSSTLGRIENMDIKTPSLDQVVKVLRGTGHIDELLELIDDFYPEISKTYSNYYTKYPISQASEGYKKYITNPSFFKLLLMAVTGGVTESEIKETFGRDGVIKLKELTDQKIVAYSHEQNSFIVSDQKVMMDDTTTYHVLKMSIDNFMFNYKKDDPTNYLSYETWEVDSDIAIPLVSSIIEKARSDIYDLLVSDKCKGHDRIFMGITVSPFSRELRNDFN